jgi:excisionase family DNA binding protein
VSISELVKDELLTVKEAALAAKCNEMTVRRWIDSGELKALKLGDRMIRIRAQDFDDFMRPIYTGGDHAG